MLYIVATPIGNLEDITLRALRVLREADIIAAEDTRRTVKLLNHFEIKTKLISFHEHSGEAKRAELISELKAGKNVALVSDAGTPLISDPGAQLVAEAADAGIEVTSVPGPCAAVTAMTLSTLSGPFAFLGFLSKKSSERKQQIEDIAASPLPCVIYESPHMLIKTLGDLKAACGGERFVSVAKELTKLHESVFRGKLINALEWFSGEIKGEYTLVIGAAPKKSSDEISDADITALLRDYIAGGMTKKDAAEAASKVFGISKNRAYKLVISF